MYLEDAFFRRCLLRSTGLQSLSIDTSARAWVSTTLTAFTTTHWVINRIHDNTTVVRTASEPARTAGFTRLLKSVVAVSYHTNGSTASCKYLASLTRR